MVTVTVADLANELRVEAADATDDFVAGIAKQINDAVLKQNQRFFQSMSFVGVDRVPGAGGAPDVGEYAVAWQALTEKYMDWKIKHKLSLNFYKKRGDLQQELARLKTSDLLGDATTTLRGGPQGDPNVKLRQFTRTSSLGRSYTQRVGFNVTTGRFAKFTDIFRPARYYIEVLPFPKVVGINDDHHSLESAVFGQTDPVLFFKFTTGVRGHQLRMQRPLLGPFMNWWINASLKHTIEGIVG